MPRKSKFPRLRVHVRKGRGGQVWTYYFYDMRPDGKPDIALGSDYETALAKWDELHNRKPRIAGTILEAMEAWERDVLPNYASDETRKGYTRQLGRIKGPFGGAAWHEVELKDLKAYLKKRTAKTQGNRELAVFSIIWNWARGEGYTSLPWPAAGMERSKWKNKENARQFEVTDELFDAVYPLGDQVLRDAMDIASSTAIRLKDVVSVLLPPALVLRVKSSKTGKMVDFDASESPVLVPLIERRRASKADHLMLLSTPAGRRVSLRMLRDRWDDAREKAAKQAREDKNEPLAELIEAMFLRDMRKRASDLAESDEDAAKLLQHSSVALTRKHYRTKPTKLRTVR
jgi:hypothetical protein